MKLLIQVRYKLINELWKNYANEVEHAKVISNILLEKKKKVVFDHFAVIDLPSENTGISTLSQIFSCLGFIVQGRDYLPEKQNEFLWMVEQDASYKLADSVLPQVVVADFWLSELPISIRKIVEKYTNQIKVTPLPTIQRLTGQAYLGNLDAANELLSLLINYFNGREWDLPTFSDFKAVHEANELLAWVLLFGRKPNHFTISVHLLGGFTSLADFHSFVSSHVNFTFNEQGGTIKGNQQGVVQSSTMADLIKVQLVDGDITIRDRFVEFIWRYPKNSFGQDVMWDDFYTGFIAKNANRVIESLYD